MKFNKWFLSILMVAAVLFALPAAVQAQTTATTIKPALASTVICRTATTNLAAAVLVTNLFTPAKHLGVGVVLVGGDATNNGVVGLQFNAVFAGTNNLKTTTKPITITTTANGTTVVRDWIPVPDYTAGPCPGLVLGTITNAAVNIGTGPTNSIIVSNAWLEYR